MRVTNHFVMTNSQSKQKMALTRSGDNLTKKRGEFWHQHELSAGLQIVTLAWDLASNKQWESSSRRNQILLT